MTWYYNNEGAANGPHDDKAMQELAAKGLLNAHTLIWQNGMELWKEAGTLKPEWWQPLTNPPPEVKKPESSTSLLGRRTPQPLAPSEKGTVEKKGLLSRLFGKK